MRALILHRGGEVTLEHVPPPSSPGECAIRVTYAGICGTDLQMRIGYANFTGILGHEFVGVVEHAPPDAAGWQGKRVVGEINVGCGTCEWCARGVKEHCTARTVVGIRGRAGAFAEYISLPAANLHEVPGTVNDECAVFVEPIAAAYRIAEQVPITRETRVAVIGDGRLGNLTAQVLRTLTDHLVLFGRHEWKMQVARQVGIDARRVEDGRSASFDIVVEATGRPQGFAIATALARPRGTIILKSTYHGAAESALPPVTVHEISVVGSRCGPFAPALALLASGFVRPTPLVSHVSPLERHADAFARAARELKVLFDMRR